jgi:hypothetical protein
MNNQEFCTFLKDNNLIVFEAIVGSQAYGTSNPNSDIDKKFVYILPIDYIFGLNYVPQIEVNKDYVGYEIKRFLELLSTNNPTILEMLNVDDDCVTHKDRVFDYVVEKRDEFLTKMCANSFGGYARQQLQKASGLNKKQNWEKERVERKEPIDFCYVIDGYKSYPITDVLRKRGLEQKFCGISNIPHVRDMYVLFYDWKAFFCFSESIPSDARQENKEMYRSRGQNVGLGYKGLQKVGEGKSKSESNSLRLSSIPKGEKCEFVFSYNKDAYTIHCDEYNDYQKWLLARNPQRWVDVQNHNQKIDGKNMMHCMRLIRMAMEIARGEGVNVKRKDAQELLKIRRGELSLEELTKQANDMIIEVDEMFRNSSIPEGVDQKMVNELLIKIRREFYKI